MKNAEWCIRNNIRFKDLCGGPTCVGLYEESIGYYDGVVFHQLYHGPHLGEDTAESVLVWLDLEHREEVLNSTEKQYLAAIIKPFRHKVQFIKKTNDGFGRRYCGIVIKFTDPTDDIYLPRFRADSMYKGMKMYRNYRLEELGL